MIRLIEALNFRCLRYVRQPLDSFHVLVGPNASGKTTFLDVVAFLGRLVADGPHAAITERTQTFQDLLWGRTGERFELAIEVAVPDDCRGKLPRDFDTIRYEVAIGTGAQTDGMGIVEEYAFFKQWAAPSRQERALFPSQILAPVTIITRKRSRKTRRVLAKVPGGNDNFYSEVLEKSGKGWFPSIKLGPHKSALGNLPQDESRFPASTWLRKLLIEGVQKLVLNSLLIRRPSPPGQVRGFKSDGSNLPWVVADFRSRSEERFRHWIAHLQTALPDVKDIETIEREEDKHRYLVLCHADGLRVPSWVASDGTLRLLALTLPAYLPEFRGIYLIEEPENGIHPRAIATMFESLCSVYDAQILLATHSPVILSAAEPRQVLCFKKTEDGATDIVRGDEHPALKEWRGETTLGSLLAAGVLG
ncbi:MAG: methylation-associated defense system AAA family ATPase MAD3 [Thermoguttaceae bacterium]